MSETRFTQPGFAIVALAQEDGAIPISLGFEKTRWEADAFAAKERDALAGSKFDVRVVPGSLVFIVEAA